MVKKYILAFFVTLLFGGCNQRTYNCVNYNISYFEERFDFDYYEYSIMFEHYLLEKKILENESLNAWKAMITKEKYCSIVQEDFIRSVDNSFSTAPSIGATFIECASSGGTFFSNINADSLYYGPEYALSLLSKLEPKDFKKRQVKAFFVYLVSTYMPTCPNRQN